MLRALLLTLLAFVSLAAAEDRVSNELPVLRTELPEESSLFFSGGWLAGEGYLNRIDLARLDGYKTIRGVVIAGVEPADLGVLPLESLIDALGLPPEKDGIVLECTDRWESFMELSYVAKKNPLLLVYYNGEDPTAGNWPIFGGDIEPLAPFYVFIEGDYSGFAESPAFGMISATQMSGIRAVNTEIRYRPFFGAPMDQLSELAQEGRSLFLQRCNNCHQGPGETGGNTSQRPFQILQLHASFNEAHLRKVVTNPKEVFPETIMPPHPDFEDSHFEQLIAYLKESYQLLQPPP
ncbi:MAG: hypothetical protein AAGB46_15060 [Verrucomicrobiota bacterium]